MCVAGFLLDQWLFYEISVLCSSYSSFVLLTVVNLGDLSSPPTNISPPEMKVVLWLCLLHQTLPLMGL